MKYLILGVGLLIASAQGQELTYKCQDSDLSIKSASPLKKKSLDTICLKNKRLTHFLKAKKQTISPVTLELIKEYPDYLKQEGFSIERTYGLFDPENNRLFVTHPDYFLPNPKNWFGVDMQEELFPSVVVHELSHAYLQANYQKERAYIPEEQTECLAYSIQISSLPFDLRQEVIETHIEENRSRRAQVFFENDQDINLIQYQFAPFHFAVKCFLFMQTADGEKYFQDVINGLVPSDNLFY